MQFKPFISHLSKALQSNLPGADAQYIMAPETKGHREKMLEKDPNPRQGSVMVLFYPVQGVPYLVLIKRAEYEGHHSGQVSFPGGRKETQDEGMLQTALRETHEEVGVHVPENQIIGALSKLYIPPSKYLVSPFVGFFPQRPAFVPDGYEVSRILEVSLQHLLHEKSVKQKELTMASGQILLTPYFDVEGHVVWGATAMILSELLYVIRNGVIR